jgi:prepilin-type N-terminal cleavage/methylation domain-containing protein
MKVNGRTGFTIIEVVLVLAISAMLFVALIAGQGNNLARRRYDDSVHSFMEFLQSQFDFAMNIQNFREGEFRDCTITGSQALGQADAHRGRSNCAIHGVMLEFGSTHCTELTRTNRTCREYVRHTYVIGGDIRSANNNADGWYSNFMGQDKNELEMLRALNLQRVMPWQDYRLEWGSEIEVPAMIDGVAPVNASGSPQGIGAILIVRMPISNTIRVFVRNSDLPSAESIFHPNYGVGNNTTKKVNGDLSTLMLPRTGSSGNADALTEKFICVSSPDSGRIGGANSKRVIAINPSANNASAVQLFMQDEQNILNGVERNVRCSK